MNMHAQFLNKKDPVLTLKEILYERLLDRRELLRRSKKNLSAYDSYQSGQWDAQENCWEDEIDFLQDVLHVIERS